MTVASSSGGMGIHPDDSGGSGGSGGGDSGGSGGSGGQDDYIPNLSLDGADRQPDGSYKDVVGDNDSLQISSPEGQAIGAAYVNIDNAKGQIIFTTGEASSEDFTEEATSGSEEVPWLATVDFNWNENAGMNTIEVEVLYLDGGYGYNELTVNVLTPTFTALQDVQQPVSFGNSPQQYFGIYQAGVDNTQNPPETIDGNVFSANVTLPNTPAAQGHFAFLSTVDMDITINSHSSEPVTYTSDGQMVLDDGKDATVNNAMFVHQYISQNLLPNAMNVAIGGTGTAIDSPGYGIQVANYPNGDWVGSLSYDADFKTYLMYQAANGAWVGIGSISWSVNYALGYVGPVNGQQADYTNTANWDVTAGPTPAAAQTLTGAVDPWFPEWDKDTATIFAGN